MTGTRSQTKEQDAPTCHVLNYYYDDANGFALTVLIHTLRFHIMIDYTRLASAKVQEEYKGLLDAIEAKEEKFDTKATSGQKRKRGEDAEQRADSAHGSSPRAASVTKRSSASSVTLADDDREDNEAVREMQNWILASFGDIFSERAPVSEEHKPKTVHDWFHSPVYYYTLSSDGDGNMTPEEEDPTSELGKEIADLVPGLELPKYIATHNIPIFTTTDLEVLETSDTPSPRHPAVVKATSTGATHFLKLVDPSQPGPVKRELRMLKDIETKGLHRKIRVPLVEGLVVDSRATKHSPPTTSASHRPRILGFLLTAIPGATPLTTTLDADVAEGKREHWAHEVERAVKVLHDNGFVWGDSKADNFMVDDKARLWIIDFGGSYTEGWVDAELNETVEGDDMGKDKIVSALRDPEGFTFDPEGDEEEEGRSAKRSKHDDADDKSREVDVDDEEEKVRRLQHGADAAEDDDAAATTGYCYCDGPDNGTMIACDGEDCAREWFHAACVGGVPAEDNEKWYCDDCKAS